MSVTHLLLHATQRQRTTAVLPSHGSSLPVRKKLARAFSRKNAELSLLHIRGEIISVF